MQFPYNKVAELADADPGSDAYCIPFDEMSTQQYLTQVCTSNDVPMALSQCTFIEASCGPNQEFTKSVGDSISEIRINNNFYGGTVNADSSTFFDCPFKLKSSNGAPGFAIDMSDFEHNEIETGSRPIV